MDAEFQKQGLTGLTETDLQAVVAPGETLRLLPAHGAVAACFARKTKGLLPLSRFIQRRYFPALKTLLVRTGFTIHQIREMRLHLIRWQLISEEEFDRE